MERILIAGTSSGVGKTTVTAGIAAALRRRGRHIVPFKVGPDYIDPGFHTLAAGTAAGSLDSWMVPRDQVLETLERVPEGGLALIEGVMGLYDGRRGEGEKGSTAHVAKITRTPVILVASGAKMARSAAALVGGYIHFDPEVTFAGVIFNHVSGESHFSLIKQAVSESLGIPVFGYLPKDVRVKIPERHLGLLPTSEMDETAGLLDRLANLVEETVDVQAVAAAAAQAPPLPKPACRVFPPVPPPGRVRIAVARDEAFHFYYQENLELLSAFGAEIVYFSPLADRELPTGTAGVILGGGFPEMFAGRLAANKAMRAALASAAARGMPVYAECGGYMYLARELVDFTGHVFPMAGLFPGRAVMQKKRRALGYVEVTGTRENFLLQPGERCRGHEFHWSEMENTGLPVLYRKLPGGEAAGEARGKCAGSYIHLHFLSNPAVAQRFMDACRQYREAMGSV